MLQDPRYLNPALRIVTNLCNSEVNEYLLNETRLTGLKSILVVYCLRDGLRVTCSSLNRISFDRWHSHKKITGLSFLCILCLQVSTSISLLFFEIILLYSTFFFYESFVAHKIIKKKHKKAQNYEHFAVKRLRCVRLISTADLMT